MNSGHHMAHVKKKVGRHEILFSKQRKRFCVKFVSREKKLVQKKSSGFWQLVIFLQRFNIGNCSLKKVLKKMSKFT